MYEEKIRVLDESVDRMKNAIGSIFQETIRATAI